MLFDLSKVGKILRTAREERKLTLQQVADALFIRKRIIEAIELGQWENLPHAVYVKGYVTQYADFLSVQESVSAVLTVPVSLSPASELAGMTAKVKRPPRVFSGPQKRFIGTIAVVMVAAGFFVFQNLDRPTYVARPVKHQAQQSQPPAPTYQAVSADSYSVYTPNSEEKSALEAKKLTIACQQRTWLRIVIDGWEEKEFMMNPEEVLVLNGKEGFDLLIGNAGGIRLFYNGKDTGFVGSEGEVKRLSLS